MHGSGETLVTLGAMQHWPLRVMRVVDHAEREHGDTEIVTAWANGSITRTNWREIVHDGRKLKGREEAGCLFVSRSGNRGGGVSAESDLSLHCCPIGP